jgi:chromate transporter
MVPLMKAECVDQHGWMTDAEFMDALAVGNTLPGPIAAKMGVAVGLKVEGWMGALVALLAVVGPCSLLMVVLFGLARRYQDHPAMAGAMKATRPVVVGLLVWTALDLGPAGLKDGPRAWLFAAAALSALLLDIHPALVVLVAMVVGALSWR